MVDNETPVNAENNSNTTLVKVKCTVTGLDEQINPYSNTTLVKVKLTETQLTQLEANYSNTTLVKVKFNILPV